MKTQGIGPANPRQNISGREPARTDSTKKSAFAKLMHAAEPDAPVPATSSTIGGTYRENNPLETAQVRSVKLPAALEGLVSEIQVSLSGESKSEVQIQFDSKTMAGLHVRIAKENGMLAVAMTSQSAEMNRMLATNAEGLAQALAARGYVGATVAVRETGAPSENRPEHARQPSTRQGSSNEPGGGQKRGQEK